MASDCPVERKGHHLIFSPGKKKERLLRREGQPLSTSPEGLLARGFPGNLERMLVYGALKYHPSLPGLLSQVRIRGGWREVEQQKALVLELVGLEETKV